MKITFNIAYNTIWGQQIGVLGSIPELGSGDVAKAFRLEYLPNGKWQKSINLNPKTPVFSYKYILLNDHGEILDEDWGEERSFDPKGCENTHSFIQDAWRSKNHPDNALYSSAFLNVIFKAGEYKLPSIKKEKGKLRLQFQMHCLRLSEHQQLCITGNTPELGNWNLAKPKLLVNPQHPLWQIAINIEPTTSIEYKFGIYDNRSNQVQLLETGENRKLDLSALPSDVETFISTDEYFRFPFDAWKGAGVAVPVFSLRSEKGFGVGSFEDIKGLVDWSHKVGLKMVQILPINDTTATYTWVDSYPYAAISVFALHPMYLDLEQLDGFDQHVSKSAYRRKQKTLNQLSQVDYEAVLKYKLKYARQVFEAQQEVFLESKAFKTFLKENGHWLKPYALFCYLRDLHGSVNFQEWTTGSTFSQSLLRKMTSARAKCFSEIAFYYYLQFHLDQQLKNATAYARAHGIVLKGDIPIGIYRYSVDAWVAPELYNMNGQSGAPPDPFSATGQNWGFPTYNWEEMAKDGYEWWRNRLQQLSHYFDAFRIDHILGFFRIWEIPLEQVEGSFGFFNKAIPISVHEFAERGIHFDYKRFCKPYLPLHLLYHIFRDDCEWVLETFLEKDKNGQFQFKSAFDTQRKVELWFKTAAADKQHLKQLLFNFLSNVLFFEVPGSKQTAFHPRIDFMSNSTFQELEESTRHKLEVLYNDYFYHRQEDFWKAEAMIKLPAIKQATNMLICGEDLGMVPACVPGVMNDLGFLTLEIQRMSKNPETEFLQATDIPYWSVCSPSTHDMSPLRLWWEECDEGQRARFYYRELGLSGMPPKALTAKLAAKLLTQHLAFPGMWTVFPIQDILAMDENLRLDHPEEERINVPANPQHYWRYRFHLNTEELLKAEDFNARFGKMIEESGRS